MSEKNTGNNQAKFKRLSNMFRSVVREHFKTNPDKVLVHVPIDAKKMS